MIKLIAAAKSNNLAGWNFRPKYQAHKLRLQTKAARSMLALSPVIDTKQIIVIAEENIAPKRDNLPKVFLAISVIIPR